MNSKVPELESRPRINDDLELDVMRRFGIGRYGAGNIDLFNRPMYRQPDGSISTVYSATYGIDGKTVLLPTIAYNPANGRPYVMSDQEALDRYRRTGEHLGIFDNDNDANSYAQKLHEQQAYIYR